jgi:hypothetical protein
MRFLACSLLLHSFPLPSSPLLSSFSSFSILSIIPLNYSLSHYSPSCVPKLHLLVIYPVSFPSSPPLLSFLFCYSLFLLHYVSHYTRICAFIIFSPMDKFLRILSAVYSTKFSITARFFLNFSLLTQWFFLWGGGTPLPHKYHFSDGF